MSRVATSVRAGGRHHRPVHGRRVQLHPASSLELLASTPTSPKEAQMNNVLRFYSLLTSGLAVVSDMSIGSCALPAPAHCNRASDGVRSVAKLPWPEAE